MSGGLVLAALCCLIAAAWFVGLVPGLAATGLGLFWVSVRLERHKR